MKISSESKKTIQARIFEINKELDLLGLDIEKALKEKAPYDEKLEKLRAKKEELKAQKQALQGDVS